MTQLSNSELTLLRTRPHRTKLWLSIYQPSTRLAARVNSSLATKGDRFIPFDSVTSGSYLLLESGMTLLVGSQLGGSDKGEIRIKSAVSSGIFVAENSYIDWEDNDYLTGKNFFEIQAIFPRIIQDPNDPTQTIWYKDYDIPYTNQNTVLGSFICMGSHYAGFLSTGTCSVFYTATGTSYIGVGASSLSYYWFFEGATVTGSFLETPGWINYDTPGHYTTRLIVSGSAGNVDASYRHISIYDRPENGTNVPILNWQLNKLTGNRDSGGYTASIRILESLSPNEIKEGSLVVIFSDDWYGSDKQSIGRNSTNRSSIVFVGYVLDGSISFNYRDNYIDFEVASPTGLMKLARGFSISLEDIDDPVSKSTNDPGNYPSPWALLPGLNVKRALWHYLKYHSTVLMCNDFQFLGTDQNIQYFDADRESLYNVIDTAMRGILIGKSVNDSQGKVWAETDPYIESKPLNTFVMDGSDWMNDPNIDVKQTESVSFIEIGGIAYSGVTGTSTPFLAGAPGETPSYQGDIERIQGLALTSQDHLNTIAGNLYAHKNRKYPKISMNMGGNYSIFDIAPLERFFLYIHPRYNPFGVLISDDYHVENINWVYNPRAESLLPNIDFSQISTGTFADTIAIPPIPETQGYNVPPISIPPISIPPITVSVGGSLNSPILVPALHTITDEGATSTTNYTAYYHAAMWEVGGTGINSVYLTGDPVFFSRVANSIAVPTGATTALVYALFFKPYDSSPTADMILQVSAYQFNTNGTEVDYEITKSYDLSQLTFNLDFWKPDDLFLTIPLSGKDVLALRLTYDANGNETSNLAFVGWLVYFI